MSNSQTLTMGKHSSETSKVNTESQLVSMRRLCIKQDGVCETCLPPSLSRSSWVKVRRSSQLTGHQKVLDQWNIHTKYELCT